MHMLILERRFGDIVKYVGVLLSRKVNLKYDPEQPSVLDNYPGLKHDSYKRGSTRLRSKYYSTKPYIV